jgi:hypothetical protein
MALVPFSCASAFSLSRASSQPTALFPAVGCNCINEAAVGSTADPLSTDSVSSAGQPDA